MGHIEFLGESKWILGLADGNDSPSDTTDWESRKSALTVTSSSAIESGSLGYGHELHVHASSVIFRI